MTFRNRRIVLILALVTALVAVVVGIRRHVWLSQSHTSLTAVGYGTQFNYHAYKSFSGSYLLLPDESYQPAYVVDPSAQLVGTVDQRHIVANLDALVITGNALPPLGTGHLSENPGVSNVIFGEGYVSFWVEPTMEYRVNF